jgi:hypothetical protein
LSSSSTNASGCTLIPNTRQREDFAALLLVGCCCCGRGGNFTVFRFVVVDFFSFDFAFAVERRVYERSFFMFFFGCWPSLFPSLYAAMAIVWPLPVPPTLDLLVSLPGMAA